MIDDEYKINQVGFNQEDDELAKIRKKIIRYKLGIIAEILIILVITTMFLSGIQRDNCKSSVRKYAIESEEWMGRFNAPFINYQGLQNGSTVINLINGINGHNLEHTSEPELQITINGVADYNGEEIEIDPLNNIKKATEVNETPIRRYSVKNIKRGKRYRVALDYIDDDETLWIRNIRIQEDS